MLPYTLLALIVAALAAWSLNQPIKRTAGQIFEQESAYNYIEVLQKDGFTYLRLNDGQGVHSQYHPEQLFYGGPWEQFLVGPFFTPHFEPSQMKRIAIIGLAAGTTARQATEVFGAIPIDGYEIDPAIIDVGRQYFAMTMPNLNAVAADGRWGLAHSGHTYTLIAVDAYRPPYIPPHLTTREFFQMAFDRLDENGALAINVGRAPEDRRLIEDLAVTIGAVFPTVFVMDIPYTFNSIIYATKQPGSAENLATNYMALESGGQFHPLLKEAMFSAFANLQPTPQDGIIFTDDRAPIEWITNDMIVRFLLAGGAEDLQ